MNVSGNETVPSARNHRMTAGSAPLRAYSSSAMLRRTSTRFGFSAETSSVSPIRTRRHLPGSAATSRHHCPSKAVKRMSRSPGFLPQTAMRRGPERPSRAGVRMSWESTCCEGRMPAMAVILAKRSCGWAMMSLTPARRREQKSWEECGPRARAGVRICRNRCMCRHWFHGHWSE